MRSVNTGLNALSIASPPPVGHINPRTKASPNWYNETVGTKQDETIEYIGMKLFPNWHQRLELSKCTAFQDYLGLN